MEAADAGLGVQRLGQGTLWPEAHGRQSIKHEVARALRLMAFCRCLVPCLHLLSRYARRHLRSSQCPCCTPALMFTCVR